MFKILIETTNRGDHIVTGFQLLTGNTVASRGNKTDFSWVPLHVARRAVLVVDGEENDEATFFFAEYSKEKQRIVIEIGDVRPITYTTNDTRMIG